MGERPGDRDEDATASDGRGGPAEGGTDRSGVPWPEPAPVAGALPSDATNRRAVIEILLVDDDSAFRDRCAAGLEMADPPISVARVSDPETALDRVASGDIDCVVAIHRDPDRDGLSLLDSVRQRIPDLPFVLLADGESETLASRAIAAGVTDYVPRATVDESIDILAVRVRNAVAAWRTEQARQRSEARCRQLLEQNLVGIYIVQDGAIVYANPRFGDILGYEADELLGKSPLEFVAEADRDRVAANLERRERGGIDRLQYVFTAIRNDGATIDIEVDGGRIEYDGRPAILGAARDVTERAAAERQLRESEQRFRAVFDGAFDAMVLVDDEGVVEDANPAAVDMFGLSLSSLQGESLGAFAGADVDVEAARQRVRQAGTDQGTFPLVRPDGVHRQTEYTATADVLPGRHLVVLRDVTDRKAVEVELRETNQTLKAVIRASPLAIVGIDPGGRVELWNPAAERLFDRTEDEVLGEPFPLVAANQRDAFRAVRERVIEGEVFTDVAVRRRTRTGALVDLSLSLAPIHDATGAVTGMVAVFSDITERKQRERTLEVLHDATREMMQANTRSAVAERAIEAIREVFDRPIATVRLADAETGTLEPVVTSPEADAQLGDPPVAVDKRTARAVFDSGEHRVVDHIGGGKAAVDQTDDDAGVVDRGAADRSRIDSSSQGDEMTIGSRIVVPLGSHGVLVVGASEPDAFDEEDVSLALIVGANAGVALDRAEREQALREQRRELERQNDRLEEFASVVSHDLRNPLNVAVGNLSLLESDAKGEPVTRIRGALDRMAAIINDVLTLARQGQLVDDPEAVSLSTVCERAWTTVETGDATLAVEIDRDDDVIEADESRLAALFENLFRNAIEHGGDDVGVTVETLSDGFAVENDGPPIPPDERDLVFESGFTTAGDGTGFGLTIVRQIAEAHGWEIRAAEGTDGGARFEVRGIEQIER